MIFSCKKYENIQRKALNDINEVDNINFQTGNKIETPKLFFVAGSVGCFFRQTLVKVFESRKHSEEIRN